MIVTGSARSIIVKLAYQSGFEAPLTITLLYLFGQSLSLLVYRLQQQCLSNDYTALNSENNGEEHRLQQRQSVAVQEISIELTESSDSSSAYSKVDVHAVAEESFQSTTKDQSSCEREPNYDDDDESSSSASDTRQYTEPSTAVSSMIEMCTAAYNTEEEMPNGSNHGLSPQSEQRIQHKAQYIPYYIRPAIPAIFNLLNSALRWASLVFIDASVSEMLISGLELILSVIAARIIRKRIVSKSRWMGVIIVAIGVIIIERANSWKHQQKHSLEEQQVDYNDTNATNSDEIDNNNKSSAPHNVTIGVILIILQSILSVMQDLCEEIFMQATTFPAMKMLGLEGLYGFCIGLIIYSTIANKFGIEDIDNTISMVIHTPAIRWWLLLLPFLFLLTGIFNIKATEVTSAMTRNVWKNLRTVLIWIIALCIYYLGDNAEYGEAWHVPQSFYILTGFSIMTCGIVAYYWHKSLEV
jgi:drug/metabolite transporter (DMT)-like permease